MKLTFCAAIAASLFATVAFAANEGQVVTSPSTQVSITSEVDKLSYTIGADLGRNFKKQDLTINTQALVQGLKDGQSGQKLLLTQEQMDETLKSFQKKLLAKRVEKFKAASEENKKKGEAFLVNNKTQAGVVELPSGLQYKEVKAGTGRQPTDSDTVTVEYTGKLLDGKVFDSSEKAGKPATFKVTDVIPGWTEALKRMKEGATWEVYIPSKLAYGPRGIGEPIGPNETLIFTIHLLSIAKADAKTNVSKAVSSANPKAN